MGSDHGRKKMIGVAFQFTDSDVLFHIHEVHVPLLHMLYKDLHVPFLFGHYLRFTLHHLITFVLYFSINKLKETYFLNDIANNFES